MSLSVYSVEWKLYVLLGDGPSCVMIGTLAHNPAMFKLLLLHVIKPLLKTLTCVSVFFFFVIDVLLNQKLF